MRRATATLQFYLNQLVLVVALHIAYLWSSTGASIEPVRMAYALFFYLLVTQAVLSSYSALTCGLILFCKANKDLAFNIAGVLQVRLKASSELRVPGA